jgi:drug/metabolite transporter (DMT)-like permease
MSTPGTLIPAAALQGTARGSESAEPGRVRVELLVVISVVLGAAGQLMLKAALLLLSPHPIDTAATGDPRLMCAAGIVLGLCIYAVGTWFWIKAVSRAPISYLYPLSAGSYALVAICGHVLFGEIVHPWRWAGIALTTFGVALMAASGERGAA